MGIEFITATCPNCGGELRVPKDRDVVKCMYCGADIILHDNSKITIQVTEATSSLLVLAKTAIQVSNYEEANYYFAQILEQDQNCIDAWLGKGQALSELANNVHGQRQSEAITYILHGISLITDDDTVHK